MRYLNISTQISLFVIFLLCMLLVGTACSENAPIQAEDGGLDADCKDMVIARVGETDITLEELFMKPSLYQTIEELLFMGVIVREEAARLGVVVSQEQIMETIDQFYEDNGGIDVFYENLPDTMPRNLVVLDINMYFATTEIQTAIIEQVWETEHGPVTNEEVEEIWLANEQMYRSNLAAQLEVDPESITMEDAREMIEPEIKDRWTQERQMSYFSELRENYDIEFYLLDSVLEEIGDIEVPLLPEESEETHEESPETIGEDSGFGVPPEPTDETPDEIQEESVEGTVSETEEQSGE